jgi:hypothetical protein
MGRIHQNFLSSSLLNHYPPWVKFWIEKYLNRIYTRTFYSVVDCTTVFVHIILLPQLLGERHHLLYPIQSQLSIHNISLMFLVPLSFYRWSMRSKDEKFWVGPKLTSEKDSKKKGRKLADMCCRRICDRVRAFLCLDFNIDFHCEDQ